MISIKLKSIAKKNSTALTLNRIFKAHLSFSRYRASCEFYSDAKRLSLHSKSDHSFPTLRSNNDDLKLHIFYLGTDENQDKSGFLQSLSKMADTRWFIKENGDYGHNDSREPEVRTKENAARLWYLLETFSSENWIPDLVLTQTWPSLIDPDIFIRIKERWGAVIVNISMDDRHQYWSGKVGHRGAGTHALIPYVDLALTAAPECVDWYRAEGCPSLFFPEASDPEIFHPMPGLAKIHDVCFVGARYGIREKLVLALRKVGIRVTAFGSGWESGRLNLVDVPTLFAQSKIVLGVGTIGHSNDFFALKLRDFDAPMSGSMYLTHDNPDLHQLFNVGQEIVTYRNVADCVSKAQYFLAHSAEREVIAKAGRQRALMEHTWDHRFIRLLTILRKQ